MQKNISKQFLRIGSKPILFYTLRQFEICMLVDEVILVVAADDLAYAEQEIVERYDLKKVHKIISGGGERQDSVYAGLTAIADKPDLVIIHDGVRPFVSVDLIERGIGLGAEHGAVVAAVPLTSTIKRVKNGMVAETVDRSELWDIQTPQTFKYDLILSAYEQAHADGFKATDDAMMVERLGKSVSVLQGDKQNIKITTEEDLEFAKLLLDR